MLYEFRFRNVKIELCKLIDRKKKHKDNEVLIITHGGIIRLLYLLEQNKVVDETEKHVSLLTFDLDKIIKNSTRGHDGA